MKVTDAILNEITRLCCMQDELSGFFDALEDKPEAEQKQTLDAQIMHLKRIIYDDSETDTAKKGMAFRLYDSLGFVREDVVKK